MMNHHYENGTLVQYNPWLERNEYGSPEGSDYVDRRVCLLAQRTERFGLHDLGPPPPPQPSKTHPVPVRTLLRSVDHVCTAREEEIHFYNVPLSGGSSFVVRGMKWPLLLEDLEYY